MNIKAITLNKNAASLLLSKSGVGVCHCIEGILDRNNVNNKEIKKLKGGQPPEAGLVNLYIYIKGFKRIRTSEKSINSTSL